MSDQKRTFEEQLARITEVEAERASEFIFKAAHKPLLTKSKGRYRISCVCGWVVAGKFDTEEEAISRYGPHTGVIEKGRR